MADLRYNVSVNTAQATAALKSLESSVSSLTGLFAGLLGAIGVRELIAFSDSITNVRNRLNQLSPTVDGVTRSFEGIAAIAIAARTPLEQTADLYFRIARGADQLGISQAEAAQITESVAKAISSSGISAQEAAGPLLQLGQALQSGRFQGDELRSILEGLPPVTRALANSLGVPIGALKELGSQGKITAQDFIKAMREAKDSIENDFAKTIPTISQAFTNLKTTIALVFDRFQQDSKTGQQLALTIEYIAAQIFFMRESIDSVMGPLTTFFKVIAAIAAFTIVGKVIRGIAGAVAALGQGLGGIAATLGSVGAAVAAFLGVEKVADDVANIGKEGTKSADLIKKFREELAKMKGGFDTAAGAPVPAYLDPLKLARAREEVMKIGEAYKITLNDQIKRLQLENSLVGASEQQRAVKTALAELESGYLKTVTDLMNKYREASISGKEEDAAKLEEVKNQLQIVTAAYQEQIGVVTELTNANITLNEAYKQRQALAEFSIRAELDNNKKLRDVLHEMSTSTMSAIEKKYADIRYAAQESARAAIEQENSRRRQLKIAEMTAEEEQKYRDAAMKGTEDLIRAEQQAYEKSRQFSTGWKRAFQEYVDNATNAAKRAESIFRKVTQGMEDLIVNFVKTGKFEWKNFVAMMLEELLRAQIQQIFAQLLGGMQDTMRGGGGGGIMGAIGGLFGGGNSQGSGGGVMDAIGGLLGGGAAGSSPSNPLYVIDISGGGGGGGVMGPMQQGGGIWDSIKSGAQSVWNGVKSVAGSVWDTVKNVGGSVIGGISNAVGGIWDTVKNVGGSVIGGISNAVSGIGSAIGGFFGGSSGGGGGGGSWLDTAASFASDLFGGWFANGGTLGAGKWGIAGENGPEMISGPATVTPMTGTNVTYNINAVDAMSFKQMLAQDPSFIYGLTMQGSKGIAARR